MFFAQVKKALVKPVLVSCSCRRSISVSYTLKRGVERSEEDKIKLERREQRKNKGGDVEGKKGE